MKRRLLFLTDTDNVFDALSEATFFAAVLAGFAWLALN